MSTQHEILATRDLTMRFGALQALNRVDIAVRRGEIFGLLGPNGSGKTTWMNCVTGIHKPSGGKVNLLGRDVTGRPPYAIYHAGLGRTFQLLENFPAMSVTDNLLLAIQESRGTIASRLLRFSEKSERGRAEELLEFMGLTRVRDEPVRNLSYGQQKLCDLAMTLMPDPDVILLDEPMAGVNPALIEQLADRIEHLCADGKTFVIIEHNMKVVMRLCSRLVVLDHGEKIAEGPPRDIQNDEAVMDAYFGT